MNVLDAFFFFFFFFFVFSRIQLDIRKYFLDYFQEHSQILENNFFCKIYIYLKLFYN